MELLASFNHAAAMDAETVARSVYEDLRLSITHENKPAHRSRGYKVVGQPNGVYDQARKDDRVLEVKLTVTNTGSIASDEVVEIYAKLPEGTVKKAKKQLIGFQRVRDLVPGEARRVELSIPIRELSCYDVISESLTVEAGSYEITAAARLWKGNALKIEAVGPFQYNWFMMV